jgi:hypothetical protein
LLPAGLEPGGIGRNRYQCIKHGWGSALYRRYRRALLSNCNHGHYNNGGWDNRAWFIHCVIYCNCRNSARYITCDITYYITPCTNRLHNGSCPCRLSSTSSALFYGDTTTRAVHNTCDSACNPQ